MTYNLMPKNAEKFYCEKCDFGCSKKSNYDKHLLTRKHKILTNTYEMALKNAEYLCDCGKKYKHRQSLHHHKKTCQFIEESHFIEDSGKKETTKNEYNSIIDEFTNIIAKQQETIEALVPKIGIPPLPTILITPVISMIIETSTSICFSMTNVRTQ